MSGIQNISQYTKGVEICVEHFPSKYVGKEPKEGIDCNTQKDTAKKRNKSEEPPSWDVLAKMKETTCCWSLLLSIISCFCPNWYFSSSTTGNFYHFKPSPQPPPTSPNPPRCFVHLWSIARHRDVAVYDGRRPRGRALPAQRGAADLGSVQARRSGHLDGQGLTTDGRPWRWGMRPTIVDMKTLHLMI